ncbi:MAG: hypothetical protein CM1200mP12_19820 [Gammaproteobacteria bacterium]|nr:MAG: hypothetical protein CM1200mP12_19820 [Gammaproteobacteria bacterium]
MVDNTIARRDFTTSETRLGLETQSVNDGDTYNLSYQNNIGGLNLSLSHKDSQFGNFDIPNGAVIHREEEHHDDDHDEEEGDHDEHEEDMGYLANSDFESESTRIGISKTGEWGYFGLSANKVESLYGIPFHGKEGGAPKRGVTKKTMMKRVTTKKGMETKESFLQLNQMFLT